jgi:precorrin-6B methylase 2
MSDPAAQAGALDPLLREALAPLGRALAAYATGDAAATVVVYVEDEPPDPLLISYFFREPSAMGAIDREALELARGAVLDVGACAGAHSVPLVQRGLAVTAIDVIPEAVEILRARGVADARVQSVWTLETPARFDTILALMNGTSVAGTAGRLVPLLERLRDLIATGGQLLIDSTQLEDDLGGAEELHYQLQFGGERGPPFPQLFVGEEELERGAADAGWEMRVVAREGSRYLARLTLPGGGS